MYIKLKNGAIDKYPYSLNELIRDNPNTSFPAEISEECASEFDVYPVTQVEYPQVDHTKNVIETAELVGEKWTQKFSVVDATPEEIAFRVNELNAMAQNNRASAYRNESDPLFFKWQRGEATQQEWLDKVAEIKARYPKVE
jgi:hypothetical protein